MRVYQKEAGNIKGSVQVLDQEVLVSAASEGLLALSVRLGLEVYGRCLRKMAYAGKKGQHNKDRTAYRHGEENAQVVMGCEKVQTHRPRVRNKNGKELPLPTLSLFQKEDPLNDAILEKLLCGVSTRKYARTRESDIQEAMCVSKSEVSRRFNATMEKQMEEFFSRPIELSSDDDRWHGNR